MTLSSISFTCVLDSSDLQLTVYKGGKQKQRSSFSPISSKTSHALFSGKQLVGGMVAIQTSNIRKVKKLQDKDFFQEVWNLQ